MKNLFLSFILLVACGMPSTSWSQLGQLRLTISSYNIFFGDLAYEDSTCFQLSVFNTSDTVYSYNIDDFDDLEWIEMTIDSLVTGYYSVNITNCGTPSDELTQSITRIVEIRENEIAELDFDLSKYVSFSKLDEDTQEEIIVARSEMQIDFSYFDFRWNPDGNNPKFNLGLGVTGYFWGSFSKHVGFLMGGGAGFTFAPLRIDETENSSYPDEIKSSYYNYIYAKYDMKLRFSSLNQQRDPIKAHNFLFDIGVQYNLPFYFKRVTRFNIQDKLVNSFIHRYSDVRIYANLGIANFQLFASYRPFDFIGKDFPEFPRYNAGVKFNIHI